MRVRVGLGLGLGLGEEEQAKRDMCRMWSTIKLTKKRAASPGKMNKPVMQTPLCYRPAFTPVCFLFRVHPRPPRFESPGT